MGPCARDVRRFTGETGRPKQGQVVGPRDRGACSRSAASRSTCKFPRTSCSGRRDVVQLQSGATLIVRYHISYMLLEEPQRCEIWGADIGTLGCEPNVACKATLYSSLESSDSPVNCCHSPAALLDVRAVSRTMRTSTWLVDSCVTSSGEVVAAYSGATGDRSISAHAEAPRGSRQ